MKAKILQVDGVNIQDRQLILIKGVDVNENGINNIKIKRYINQGKRNRFHRHKLITKISLWKIFDINNKKL